ACRASEGGAGPRPKTGSRGDDPPLACRGDTCRIQSDAEKEGRPFRSLTGAAVFVNRVFKKALHAVHGRGPPRAVECCAEPMQGAMIIGTIRFGAGGELLPSVLPPLRRRLSRLLGREGLAVVEIALEESGGLALFRLSLSPCRFEPLRAGRDFLDLLEAG